MSEELSLNTKQEADATPAKEVRRWLLEIKLAQKREKDWRKTARKVLDTYRGKERKKNSFNILWANTEVLRPAVYNSSPKPDVRRRFRQNDALGKAVSEVSERSLSYCVDAYDLDACLKTDVLDSLLPGRGLSRVRYIPQIKQVADPAAASTPAPPADGDVDAAGSGEAFQGTHEEVEYEQALCDHVQWDDFIHGYGKTWQEVPWVGFRHKLNRDAQIEKFGEDVAKLITLDDLADEDINDRSISDAERQVFKTAEFWEVWDKDGEKVFFVNESYKNGLIYALDQPKGEPPIKFKNFFPCPQPLQMVEDTGNLTPIPLYELYREQAEELDRISARINTIIKQCRVRFVYDPTLSELKALMDAADGEGIPAENARAWMANGGVEKAIWWMPVEQIARVLKELYLARDAAKQVIYEVTGLSDILRGATDPNETLGAQQLKANSSSMRLQRMQREVQRYVRDLIRLLAEVIGEHFSQDTLAKMTGLQFPTNMQKQEIRLQIQAGQQQLQQATVPGQPPPQIPPEVQQKLQQAQQALAMPSWEDILSVLRSDMQREYRVDVETDSTVAESLTRDMEGLKEVVGGIVEFWQGVGPAVQAGAVSIDAVKAITMTIARRARMGLEVEDALESGMQAPKPQSDPRAAAEAQKQQQERLQAQHDAQLAQQQQAHEQAIAQREQQLEEARAQREALEAQAKLAQEQQQAAFDARLQQQQMVADARIAANEAAEKYNFERWKVEQELKSKETIAKISADASRDTAGIAADARADAAFEAEGDAPPKPKRKKPMDAVKEMHGELSQMVKDMMAEAAEPVRMDRGPDGRIATIRKGKRVMQVKRDGQGMTIQ